MPSSKVVAAQLKDKAGTRSHPYLPEQAFVEPHKSLEQKPTGSRPN